MSQRTALILGLLILFMPGCPYWLAGKAYEQHACCTDRVFCFHEDGQCCRVCGVKC